MVRLIVVRQDESEEIERAILIADKNLKTLQQTIGGSGLGDFLDFNDDILGDTGDFCNATATTFDSLLSPNLLDTSNLFLDHQHGEEAVVQDHHQVNLKSMAAVSEHGQSRAAPTVGGGVGGIGGIGGVGVGGGYHHQQLCSSSSSSSSYSCSSSSMGVPNTEVEMMGGIGSLQQQQYQQQQHQQQQQQCVSGVVEMTAAATSPLVIGNSNQQIRSQILCNDIVRDNLLGLGGGVSGGL